MASILTPLLGLLGAVGYTLGIQNRSCSTFTCPAILYRCTKYHDKAQKVSIGPKGILSLWDTLALAKATTPLKHFLFLHFQPFLVCRLFIRWCCCDLALVCSTSMSSVWPRLCLSPVTHNAPCMLVPLH